MKNEDKNSTVGSEKISEWERVGETIVEEVLRAFQKYWSGRRFVSFRGKN